MLRLLLAFKSAPLMKSPTQPNMQQRLRDAEKDVGEVSFEELHREFLNEIDSKVRAEREVASLRENLEVVCADRDGLAIEIERRRVSHYQEQAALANIPVLLDLLREARLALPADFYYLAGRIDDVIAQATPRGEPLPGSL